MIIDFTTHVLPRRTFEQIERLPIGFGSMTGDVDQIKDLYDFDERFRVMDKMGEIKQVISLSSPALEEVASPGQVLEIVRVANDEMAELVARYPDRFVGFLASLPLDDIDEGLVEFDRALEIGALGFQLSTQIRNTALDDPKFDPVFEALTRRGRPLLIHPTRQPELPDFPGEDGSLFGVWQSLGWPFVTSVVMWRLICRGIFDRYPDIKIVAHHLGGNIPYHAVRIERGLQSVLNKIDDARRNEERAAFKLPARDYLRMFYADTAMHGAVDPMQCGISFFGCERVVFASDTPFGSAVNAAAAIDKLELDPQSKRRILSQNAEKLLF